jgi:septum formation protein
MDKPNFSPFDKNIVLASKSPRRANLLAEAGFNYRILNINVEEDYPEDFPPDRVALYLADKKAGAVNIQLLDDHEVLLTADSIVVIQEKILNKPKDIKEAHYMLRLLSGRSHKVYTGVCLQSKTKKIMLQSETTVYFGILTDEEITFYSEKYKPFDKAGAYGIQEWIGYCKIEKIVGEYANVMGLPIYDIYKTLLDF